MTAGHSRLIRSPPLHIRAASLAGKVTLKLFHKNHFHSHFTAEAQSGAEREVGQFTVDVIWWRRLASGRCGGCWRAALGEHLSTCQTRLTAAIQPGPGQALL